MLCGPRHVGAAPQCPQPQPWASGGRAAPPSSLYCPPRKDRRGDGAVASTPNLQWLRAIKVHDLFVLRLSEVSWGHCPTPSLSFLWVQADGPLLTIVTAVGKGDMAKPPLLFQWHKGQETKLLCRRIPNNVCECLSLRELELKSPRCDM